MGTTYHIAVGGQRMEILTIDEESGAVIERWARQIAEVLRDKYNQSVLVTDDQGVIVAVASRRVLN